MQPLSGALASTAIPAMRPTQVVTFLRRKLTWRFQDEFGNDISTRIKHHMGPPVLRLYDKFGLIACIECTVTVVGFFQQHRTVEHRDRTEEFKLAPVCKSIHSLPVLRNLLGAATACCLDCLATIADPQPGLRAFEKLTTPGRTAAPAALRLRELAVIPPLNHPVAA